MKELDLFEFGRQLIDTQDLDPVYVVLHRSGFDRLTLERWLLAYWCFYHSGTSSWMVERPADFWGRMAVAAESREYPRAHERRHFRGKLAGQSVAWLFSQGEQRLFVGLRKCRTAGDVVTYVKTWYGFGAWIAFKVADMVERLKIAPLQFDTSTIQLFDSPAEGAERAWERYGQGAKPANLVDWVVPLIIGKMGLRSAPPSNDRPINVQEAETILCKWKSHTNGRYHVGEDIVALRSGLLRFAGCKTSQMLIRAGKGELW